MTGNHLYCPLLPSRSCQHARLTWILNTNDQQRRWIITHKTARTLGRTLSCSVWTSVAPYRQPSLDRAEQGTRRTLCCSGWTAVASCRQRRALDIILGASRIHCAAHCTRSPADCRKYADSHRHLAARRPTTPATTPDASELYGESNSTCPGSSTTQPQRDPWN